MEQDKRLKIVLISGGPIITRSVCARKKNWWGGERRLFAPYDQSDKAGDKVIYEMIVEGPSRFYRSPLN